MPPLPKNLSRALDLSSLAAPKNQVNPHGALAVTASNLVKDFVAASHKSVVIIICWSPRSTQSQQVLDALAKFHQADRTADGQQRWVFGSVNVDVEPAVAQAMQVQSVPLAIAIVQEQVVPLFESVPTEQQIRMVIDKVLSLATERGLVTPASQNADSPQMVSEEPEEPEESEAMDALERGDFEAAKASYQKWLQRSPFNPLAKLGLAQTELFIRTAGVDLPAAISAAATHLDDLAVQILAADAEVMQGQAQSAFDRLISYIRSHHGEDQKNAKEHLLTLFSLVDPEDPVLLQARKALASALF